MSELCTFSERPRARVLPAAFQSMFMASARRGPGGFQIPSLEAETALLIVRSVFATGFKKRYVELFEEERLSLDRGRFMDLLEVCFKNPKEVAKRFMAGRYDAIATEAIAAF